MDGATDPRPDPQFQLKLRAYTQMDSRWLARSGNINRAVHARRELHLDEGTRAVAVIETAAIHHLC